MPAVDTIVSNKYPVSRPLIMITQGTPSGLAGDYLHYLLSPAGQAIVTDEGFVPITP